MDAALATMNVLSAVESDNLLLSLVLAALVPFLARRLYRFFNVTWPQLLHRCMTRILLDREVAAVEQEGGPRNTDMNRLVDNAVFVDLLVEYIGHLAAQAQSQASGSERAGDGESGGGPWLAPPPSLVDIPYAGYRYAPAPWATASHARVAAMAEGVLASVSADAGTRMSSYLTNNFRLTLTPTSEAAMEVEPGLFVRYHRSAETLQDAKERRQKSAHAVRDEVGIAASSAMEDYLLYDLINKLQESGRRKKEKWRRGVLHGDDTGEGGNDRFLQPFHDSERSRDSDEDSRDSGSDASDGLSTVDDDVRRPQAQSPRQVVIHCRHLRTTAQREAYLRSYAVPGVTPAEQERLLLPKNRIEAFAARAWAWYAAQRSSSGRAPLFLIYPAASEASTALRQRQAGAGDLGGGDSYVSAEDGRAGDLSSYLRARRYPIPPAKDGGGKTFRSLFFAQKPRVLRMLDDFQARTGKYAIPGVARRLTWLVHGPPGTGKTSLVKAMARYLGRHVVVLQMGNICTTSVLTAWMSAAKVTCLNERSVECDLNTDEDYMATYYDDKCVHLKPEEVIYLLEDVDAIGEMGGLFGAQDADEAGLEASEDTGSDHGSDDAGSDSAAVWPQATGGEKLLRSLTKEVLRDLRENQLTVSDILRVFNGVAAPDGRVIVMTTNYPERLDPRLLHPSVLSLKIDMDDFDAEQAAQMIAHYYPESVGTRPGDLAEELRERVSSVLRRPSGLGGHAGKINPARLEQACAECDSIETLLRTLESGSYERHGDVF